MKKKKILLTALLSSMILSSSIPVFADQTVLTGDDVSSILVSYEAELPNDHETKISKVVDGYLYEGKTYIPVGLLRELTTNLFSNIDVNYNNISKDINITLSGASADSERSVIKVLISTNKNSINIIEETKNGNSITNEIEGIKILNINGSTYIPIGVFRDNLGLIVEWNASEKSVNIPGIFSGEQVSSQVSSEDIKKALDSIIVDGKIDKSKLDEITSYGAIKEYIANNPEILNNLGLDNDQKKMLTNIVNKLSEYDLSGEGTMGLIDSALSDIIGSGVDEAVNKTSKDVNNLIDKLASTYEIPDISKHSEK